MRQFPFYQPMGESGKAKFDWVQRQIEELSRLSHLDRVQDVTDNFSASHASSIVSVGSEEYVEVADADLPDWKNVFTTIYAFELPEVEGRIRTLDDADSFSFILRHTVPPQNPNDPFDFGSAKDIFIHSTAAAAAAAAAARNVSYPEWDGLTDSAGNSINLSWQSSGNVGREVIERLEISQPNIDISQWSITNFRYKLNKTRQLQNLLGTLLDELKQRGEQ